MNGPVTGRRAANAAAKEGAVRRAALELFEQRGFGRTSMADIAASSGVAERTIFRAFGSKAGIIWRDPFLSRVLARLEPVGMMQEAIAALLDTVASEAIGMSSDDLRFAMRRHALIMHEPDLFGAGVSSVGSDARALEEILSRAARTDRERRKVGLLATFIVVAVASVPVRPDTTGHGWAIELAEAVRDAAYGPLREH